MEHVKNIISRIFATGKKEGSDREPRNGTCGEQARWTLDPTTGELHISGSGRLYDFRGDKKIPWEKHLSIIRKAYIDDGITYIGFQAFAYCTALTEVHLPSSLATIGVQAFAYCKSLSAVRLPEGVGSLGDYAFSHCYGLRELHLPASLYLVGHRAFAGCAGLTAIFSHAAEPPSIHADTFEGVRPNACQVHVPAGCGETYRQAQYWNSFPHIEETNADGAGS